MQNNKNGDIELLRFLFCIIIMLFHLNNYFNNAFKCGAIGVEFFFVVTGILLAKSVRSKKVKRDKIPYFVMEFIKNKINKFFPLYILAEIIFLIFKCVKELNVHNILYSIIGMIPNVMLVDYFGITNIEMNLPSSWYLSAMIISIAILLPIMLLDYDMASKLLFPILGLFLIGIVNLNSETIILGQENVINNIVRVGLLRGGGEIALGVWGYEMASRLNEISFTKLSKVILTFIKYALYLIAILYACLSNRSNYACIILIIILSACILSFTEKTYNIHDNKIISFLGRISLPIYITHGLTKKILIEYFEKLSVYYIVVICVTVAIIMLIITDYIMKCIIKNKHYFIE